MSSDLPDVEVLDLFVIDDDGHLATAEPWQRSSTSPAQPPIELEPHEPLPKVRSGPTGSVVPAPPVRTLGLYDVFQAVAVEPVDAHHALQAGHPFGAVPGIEIDDTSLVVDGPTITWQVRLRTGVGRWRDAELLVHPSPSWVLTVIELRPTGRRRASRRFVRAGVATVGRLADRLVDAAG